MHMRSFSFVLALLLLSAALCRADEPASPNAADFAFFESKIRPLLVQHCYECHSVTAGKSEGSLKLDTREALRAGGDRGPAIIPGNPDASLLLSAVSHTDADLKMPPKKDRLPASALADLRTWIEKGAPDPRTAATSPATKSPIDFASRRNHWSFQKPQPQQLPSTKNPAWPTRPLDHFILAKLESHNLAPSADAAPETLLRRLHFDLTGLPPSPPDSAATANSYESVVDFLLASPHFAERFARHWLDVARYAESSGKEANISFPYAFRYRDYVIDAIHADLPYNQFITEQIAGDLLPYENDAERARLLIATGFLALGPKNLDEGNPLQFTADLIDEQIDALTRAVTAQSVACARCHQHKFDPFSMEDYYALAGIFASTKTFFGTAVSPTNRTAGDPLPLPRNVGLSIFHPSIKPAKVAELKSQLAKLRAENPTDLRDALRVFWTSGGIEGQLEKVDDSGQALPLAMGVLDSETIADSPLLERGEVTRLGKTIPRAFPSCIELSNVPAIPSDHSGRLELAHWLTHPDHPLTARVFVNRVWRQLFGAGLVQTVDNFGLTGEPPSHPELLDHLATKFIADGWSPKKLVKEIVLSRTYRQASTFSDSAFRADPDNRLLWRMPKRRLDAESIRDAMLFASGELDPKRPAGSLVARHIGDRPISLIGLDSKIPADLDGSLHRSIYLPILRDRLPDVLDLFDFAEPSLVTGDRETTNVPLQALYLLNSPFVQARAQALANRLLREAPTTEARIHLAFQLCFTRPPDAQEEKLATDFLTKNPNSLPTFCQSLLATAEFRNLD